MTAPHPSATPQLSRPRLPAVPRGSALLPSTPRGCAAAAPADAYGIGHTGGDALERWSGPDAGRDRNIM